MNLHAYIKLVEDRALSLNHAPKADEDTVRLYHGTNDILADEIARFGFVSSGGENAYGTMRDLAMRAVEGEMSRELVRTLRDHARSYYASHAIFFTPSYEIAAEHARRVGHSGGEVGEEVTAILKDVLGLHTTLFDDAVPAVITVEIPRAWIEGEIKPTQYEVVVKHPNIDPRYVIGVEKV